MAKKAKAPKVAPKKAAKSDVKAEAKKSEEKKPTEQKPTRSPAEVAAANPDVPTAEQKENTMFPKKF